ncbi:MAG: hypothetical protein JWO67_965 [Streptosporangiaceae bacterium]|nr:hypothetical protein [Streptosporangiaceae bacterium]
MLPGKGVTSNELFISGTDDQRRSRLDRLQRIIRRTRGRRADIRTQLDKALAGAGLSIESIRNPLFPGTTLEAAANTLEAIQAVMLHFADTLSPAFSKNTPPSATEAMTISGLLEEVKTCFQAIVDKQADKHIIAVFSEPAEKSVARVRAFCSRAVATVTLVQQALKTANPPSGSGGFPVLIDTSGECLMKNAAALASPELLHLSRSFTDPMTDPVVRADHVNKLLHECMHIVSADIVDFAYRADHTFTTLPFEQKLHNADHFAETARRYLREKNPRSDNPSPTTVDRYKDMTPEQRALAEKAVRLASMRISHSWLYALDAWDAFKNLHSDPQYYSKLSTQDTELLKAELLRVSELCQATMHERPESQESGLPVVTTFDLAALEEAINDLSELIAWMNRLKAVNVVTKIPQEPKPNELYILTSQFNERNADDRIAQSFERLAVNNFIGIPGMVWLTQRKIVDDLGYMGAHRSAVRDLTSSRNKS